MKTKIKELRKTRKLSQAELVDTVGTTRQTITSIEVGKYTASLVLAYKIAHYFDMTIEEVFDFSNIDEEQKERRKALCIVHKRRENCYEKTKAR